MRRNAKLYILVDKDWNPLAELINAQDDNKIKSDITIFQLFSETSQGEHYAILTLSDKADKLVEEYGAYHSLNNSLIPSLPDYIGEPLFGEKSNTIYLIK
jgi:hypothetical protein